MSTVTFLGAPSNAKLSGTWKDEYLIEAAETPSQLPECIAWRVLPPLPLGLQQEVSTSRDLDEEALDISFAQYHAEDSEPSQDDASLTTNGATCSLPPDEFPSFDFKSNSVLDIEELFHVPMCSVKGIPFHYTILAAILSISPSRQVVTKAGQMTPMVTLVLGDSTTNGFELTVWGSQAELCQAQFARLDIILISDFILSVYGGSLRGTSRRSRTGFQLLYRTIKTRKTDDKFRPFLVDVDLQSRLVKRVRDWVIAWVPSETQPDDTQ